MSLPSQVTSLKYATALELVVSFLIVILRPGRSLFILLSLIFKESLAAIFQLDTQWILFNRHGELRQRIYQKRDSELLEFLIEIIRQSIEREMTFIFCQKRQAFYLLQPSFIRRRHGSLFGRNSACGCPFNTAQ
jgi:hypothetical protein